VRANLEDRRRRSHCRQRRWHPPAIRDRIFDPFFTPSRSVWGRPRLDIVRRLVRQNNGEITVESQPGRTEFRVVLPAAEDDRAERSS
jgi:nitrogen-specific signal transduction histidine kinase